MENDNKRELTETPEENVSAEEDGIFFDENSYSSLSESKKHGGRLFSVLAFCAAIFSLVYVCGGFFWAVLLVTSVAIALGIVGVIRRENNIGFAWGGIIIAGLILAVCVFIRFDQPDYWRSDAESVSYSQQSGYGASADKYTLR